MKTESHKARPRRPMSRVQAHEGWKQIRNRYDDGGFSGGSMDRPALRKLLSDVEAERIDVIVVYKVDRLTRSLADLRQTGRAFRRPQCVLRLGDPVVQYDDEHGATDAKRALVFRAVRARGHRRADQGQDRRVQEEGHVDGRGGSSRGLLRCPRYRYILCAAADGEVVGRL